MYLVLPGASERHCAWWATSSISSRVLLILNFESRLPYTITCPLVCYQYLKVNLGSCPIDMFPALSMPNLSYKKIELQYTCT